MNGMNGMNKMNVCFCLRRCYVVHMVMIHGSISESNSRCSEKRFVDFYPKWRACRDFAVVGQKSSFSGFCLAVDISGVRKAAMKVPKTPPGIKMDIVINENPINKYSFFDTPKSYFYIEKQKLIKL